MPRGNLVRRQVRHSHWPRARDGRRRKLAEEVLVVLRETAKVRKACVERKPLNLPYLIEGQGEAIGFTPDGKGYYTISEGHYPQLFYYKVPHLIFQ